ncbi:MAG: Glycerophosphoryl diester phosphodiesterase [Polaromonas sp.]|nr:Glycerophosphoryl diester phosphodiesterase [Polaromonas sp.]
MFGMNMGRLGAVGGYGRAALWTPAQLNYVSGLWVEAAPLSNSYQDSAGTSVVTAVEQPVGKTIDRSGLGNHLTQPTASARPLVSARVNPLIKTEDFTNAAWTKSGITAPTAEKLPAAAQNSAHLTFQAAYPSAIIGLTYIHTVELKAAELGWAVACIEMNGDSYGRYINLATGAFGSLSGNNAPDAISAVLTAEGYWRCTIAKVATTAAAVYSTVYLAAANGGMVFLGDGVSGILARKAQMDIGTVKPYQRVNTSADYDTATFPLYDKFDGIDDGLATGPITLGSDMDCFIVLRRDSAAPVVLFSSDSSHYFGYFEASGGNPPSLNAGSSVSYFVNGVGVPGAPTSGGQLSAAIPVGNFCLLEVRNLDLSTWTSLKVGNFGGYMLNGAIAAFYLRQSVPADRPKLLTYFGNKAGLSL